MARERAISIAKVAGLNEKLREDDMSDSLDDLYDLLRKLKDVDTDEFYHAVEVLETPITDQFVSEYLHIKSEWVKYDFYTDALGNEYKGHSEDEYEELREKFLKQAVEIKDPVEKAHFIVEKAEIIKEGVKFLNYNIFHMRGCEMRFQIETCRNMLFRGATLSEIVKYLPNTTMSDVYHLGKKYFKLNIEPSEEEKKIIAEEEAEKEPDNKKTFADFMSTIRRKDLLHYDKKIEKWIIKTDSGEISKNDVIEAAENCAGKNMIYPFVVGRKAVQSAHSFEDVVKALIDAPLELSVAGLEKYYSAQELEMLSDLQEKLNAV